MVQRYTLLLLASITSAVALLAAPLTSRAATLPSHAFAGPDGGTVTLRGSVSPLTGKAHRLGGLAASRQLGVTVTLALRDTTGLDSFLSALYDPSSPEYRHFLTPQQFARQFGPTAASQQEVTSWLRTQGLKITGTSPNGVQIFARGSVPALQHAFHTSLYSYQSGGQSFVANSTALAIPAGVSQEVVAVTGLSTASHQQPSYTAHAGTSAPTGGFSPAEIHTLYNTASLLSQGFTGAGQTIAIAGFADYGSTTISTFDQQYGLSNTPTRIAVSDSRNSGAPSGYRNGQPESDMDVEISQGAAPGASILMYEAPNSDQGSINLFNKIVSDNRASIITTSWGDMEANYTPSVLSAMHQAFQEAAAQGQTVFAASGDDGAYDGTAGTGAEVLAVDYPASDPYVTGVGGTTLQSNNGQYGSESAWSDTTDPKNPGASGGGLSDIFARPSWQTGPGVDNKYSNGKRQVPDVAADADVYTGYSIYTVSRSGSDVWTQIGGTSGSAPVWAGFAAQLNNAMGKRLGFLNPALYRLGAEESSLSPTPFHDITSGNNLYYQATAGWDYTTGWGSFDGVAFLSALRNLPADVWAPIPTPVPTTAPTATATPAPSVSITKILLLHKVNGKLVTTTSLKTGETGKIIILYTSKNAAQTGPSGTVVLRQKGQAFKTLTLTRTVYKGKPALTATVKVTSKSRVGTLLAQVTVSLGSLSTSLNQTFKLLAG
jgi:kumamolisin